MSIQHIETKVDNEPLSETVNIGVFESEVRRRDEMRLAVISEEKSSPSKQFTDRFEFNQVNEEGAEMDY